jgi:hypothetical protein
LGQSGPIRSLGDGFTEFGGDTAVLQLCDPLQELLRAMLWGAASLGQRFNIYAARVFVLDQLDVHAEFLGNLVRRAQRPGLDRLDCHPPDGWVSREKLLGAAHSSFQLGVSAGFTIAVGDHNSRAAVEALQSQQCRGRNLARVPAPLARRVEATDLSPSQRYRFGSNSRKDATRQRRNDAAGWPRLIGIPARNADIMRALADEQYLYAGSY